ncbi:tRNA/tmRNA (uracil-C(5))-methyltransferase [Vibrio stylophorae]|uniref:tRNA/tmRNA (uracil-C(5))-methyltransferase n=1 Tax=Vibrio stylophorae TaxID=659351 RepID=A0ABM8ZQ91_9VIBR|nr:tRNA (uridine(54)-C5)-methyltransferase TrmA [Vibrio stylophorae]CAH0532352.1 tRNA/tmRNA (uracil-C(5))-methyltransferase [Vibrio stylophorae]
MSDTLSNQYAAQLDDKVARLNTLLAPFNPPALDVFESAPQHYRMRAEFRVWHEDDDLYYIMFNQETREKYRVDQFPAASRLINDLMPLLIESLKPCKALRHKLFQVDFLSTLSGEVLVSLLYHRQLDDAWLEAAKAMKQKLNDEGFNLNIIGRARKQKILLDRDYVVEKINCFDRSLTYQQIENSFTQPNGRVAEKMLEWAFDCTRDSQGDLLELYCGNGNFSLALAPNFERVLATELAKPSVHSAQWNIAANQIDNVQIIRMSAEEFTEAMKGVRTFRRLEEANIDLQSYNCNTIFVDPPRSGMDEDTCRMVQDYERILYISCNPDTLCENLEILSKTHRISRAALFDQFPFTHHMEAGVWLERR